MPLTSESARPASFSRRTLLHALGGSLAAAQLEASPQTSDPGAKWQRFASPDAAGFRVSALQTLEQTLYTKPTTSLMVVRSGKIAYSYGDLSRASCLASVRKSILSMLYGKYVASGQIDLNRTIGELGIDEAGDGLLPIEKSATIRHLLMSSSGIYWPAGSPGGNEATPPRGSKKPGLLFPVQQLGFQCRRSCVRTTHRQKCFQGPCGRSGDTAPI